MKIISWNVKGLRSPNKRIKILRYLKRLRPDIAFLQETHLAEEDFHRLAKLWVGQVLGSPSTQGKAGVITLIHKNFPHTLISHDNDSDGRESHTVLSCGGEEIHLYNVYGPNGDNRTFFENLGIKLQNTRSGAIVLAGDLNTVLSIKEDRKYEAGRDPPETPRARDQVLPLFLDITGLRDGWRDFFLSGTSVLV